MTGIYRIPLKRVFAKRKCRVKGDPTWEQTFGKAKCCVCKQPLKEGDPYTVVIEWKGSTGTVPVQKQKHVECPEVKKKKKGTVKPRATRAKPRATRAKS
jgi:hypothetical protein